MRYPVTMSAMLAGGLLLSAGGPVLASCEGKLLCTEFTDPPTRQEVVVAPAKTRVQPAAGEHRVHQHRIRKRAAAESKRSRHAEQKTARKDTREPEKHRARADDRAASTPAPRPVGSTTRSPPAGAEPPTAAAALIAPETESATASSSSSPKLLVEDGFNAIAAGPSDDPEQQALFVLRYLTGRAHASAVDARAPLPAPAPAEISGADAAVTTAASAFLTEDPAPAPLRHVVLLDLAAAIGGIGSLAAAFTVLSGWRFRLRADDASHREGFSMPVQVTLHKPQSPARAQPGPEQPVRKQTILRVEHLFARRIPHKAGRTNVSRVATRPTPRTRSS
ncbi:MAG TPA: hypothetical protein VHA77_15830 [Xanthobacteraceae bacterium]|nr:hypothetical protein [Xanthobacteraceae bacterium]